MNFSRSWGVETATPAAPAIVGLIAVTSRPSDAALA
jgi:hypothetical protein